MGRWRDDPSVAGVRARALAVVLAADHLRAGHDVVVAQLYGTPEPLDELAATAAAAGATYHEMIVMTDLPATYERFEARGGPRFDEALGALDWRATVAELHGRVEALVASRPEAVVLVSVDDDPGATYDALLDALGVGPPGP